MKRAREEERDLATIERECEEAYARYQALATEKWNHPDHKKKREHEERQKLVDMVPVGLTHAWLEKDFDDLGRLKGLEFTCDYDDSKGQVARYWDMTATFEKGVRVIRVDTSSDFWSYYDRFQDFGPVDFVNNPRQLWQDALAENDSDRVSALAAFCYACFDRLGDYDAKPSAAFKVPNGKKEADQSVYEPLL